MEKKPIYFLAPILFLAIFYVLFLSPPRGFPNDAVVRIEKGANLRQISSMLKENRIIKSRVAFESLVIIFGGEKTIQSANYSFPTKEPVFTIALRIVKGEDGTPPISVTTPEGFDINQIAELHTSRLLSFNKDNFLLKAKPLEGYLFPDTYFYLTDANEMDVIKSMNKNFQKKIAPLAGEVAASGKSEKDIIIMASLIEGEAKGGEDREIISGILWKRISIGMPLQADAAPETYDTKGLPKAPIGNPGLLAIKAAIHPENSAYLYYLHDKEGKIHYAQNFSEHLQNKAKYLK